MQQMIGYKLHGDLSLTIRILIDRGGQSSILEERCEFREEIGRDDPDLSRQSFLLDRLAHWNAVGGTDVNACQIRLFSQQLKGLVKDFFLLFMSLNNGDDLASTAFDRKGVGKALDFFFCAPRSRAFRS